MAKTYRAAVIGSTGRGNYGHGIDTVWREVPGIEVVAVADDNRTGIPAAMKATGAKESFNDYRQMLDRVKPDIVGIGPRWLDQHHDMVLACADRGIHMYMEKPFTRTLVEADAMVAACERTHVKLAVAHQTRYSPLIEIVRQMIADGKIGRVLELRGRGKEDRRGGAEDLWILGSHIMNLIRTFGGDVRWCFAQVRQNDHGVTKADVAEGNEGLGPLAGDQVSAMYGLDQGVTAYFGTQRSAGGGKSRFGLQILGTAGVIEITSGYHPTVNYLADPAWSPGRSGLAWQAVGTQGVGKPETATDAGLHGGNIAAVKDLLAAIEADRQPLCSAYDARAAIEMIVAAFESQRVGGPVTLPLKTRVNPLTLL
ncbi:MAG: Gfo/Idh/MocA family oxidoreductase [Pirellulales bacterium]